MSDLLTNSAFVTLAHPEKKTKEKHIDEMERADLKMYTQGHVGESLRELESVHDCHDRAYKMLESMKHLQDSIAAHSINGVSSTLEMKAWITELKSTRAEFERLEQEDKLVRERNEQVESALRKNLSKLAGKRRPGLLQEYKQLFAL